MHAKCMIKVPHRGGVYEVGENEWEERSGFSNEERKYEDEGIGVLKK